MDVERVLGGGAAGVAEKRHDRQRRRKLKTGPSKGVSMLLIPLICSHVLLAVLVALIFMPGSKSVPSPLPFVVALCLTEAAAVARALRKPDTAWSTFWIVLMLWVVFLFWEGLTTKFNRLHPVLFPSPEAVFGVFANQWPVLLQNVVSSMELLLFGAVTALAAGVLLGLLVGWVRSLREIFTPLAQVLAPIPSVVFAPYLVAVMPSFRSASAMVIFLGLFWPTFLNTVIRVASLDRHILDSARMLELNSFSMVGNILLPFMIPGVVAGLRVQLTSSIMMLTFAEMLGAKSGMGYYIINYTNFANYTNVLAGIIVVGLVVTALNAVIALIEKHAVRWR